jgi:hypothetical protein
MYIDIPWTILGSLWIFAEATGKLSDYLHELDSITIEYLEESCVHLRSIPKTAKQIIYRHERHNRFISQMPHSSRNTWYEWFQTGYLVLVYAFIGSVTLAIGKFLVGELIAVTLFPPSTAPFTSTGFFAWHIHDADTARRANRDILVAFPIGSETSAYATTGTLRMTGASGSCYHSFCSLYRSFKWQISSRMNQSTQDTPHCIIL